MKKNLRIWRNIYVYGKKRLDMERKCLDIEKYSRIQKKIAGYSEIFSAIRKYSSLQEKIVRNEVLTLRNEKIFVAMAKYSSQWKNIRRNEDYQTYLGLCTKTTEIVMCDGTPASCWQCVQSTQNALIKIQD